MCVNNSHKRIAAFSSDGACGMQPHFVAEPPQCQLRSVLFPIQPPAFSVGQWRPQPPNTARFNHLANGSFKGFSMLNTTRPVPRVAGMHSNIRRHVQCTVSPSDFLRINQHQHIVRVYRMCSPDIGRTPPRSQKQHPPFRTLPRAGPGRPQSVLKACTGAHLASAIAHTPHKPLPWLTPTHKMEFKTVLFCGLSQSSQISLGVCCHGGCGPP